MTAEDIITNTITQSGTDASRATVLSLLNEQYASQIVKSRWLLEEITVGTTAAGTESYALADAVVDILALKVGGTQYEPISVEQYWQLGAGRARLSRSPGAYALTYSSSGGTSVTLYPEPETAGDAIVALAPATATALTDSAASSPVTPSDTHGSLIDGTTALILLRVDERPDLAAPFFARFEQGTEQLRRRKNSRSGNTVQALIAGVHW